MFFLFGGSATVAGDAVVPGASNSLDVVQAAGVGFECRGGSDHLVQRDHQENEVELLTPDRERTMETAWK